MHNMARLSIIKTARNKLPHLKAWVSVVIYYSLSAFLYTLLLYTVRYSPHIQKFVKRALRDHVRAVSPP